MKVRQLIEILQSLSEEDKELYIHTLARSSERDERDTYRGISQIFKQRDILGETRIIIADGKDKK